MVDIGSYRFPDVGARFDRGYERGNALRQDRARVLAGNALRGGDYGAAAGELYGAGDLAGGAAVEDRQAGQMEAQRKAQTSRRDEAMKFTVEASGRLASIYRQGKDVNRTLSAFDQMAPQARQYGLTDDDLAQTRAAIAKDPEGTLMAMGAGAAKELNMEFRTSGDEVLVFAPGNPQPVARYRGSKTTTLDEGQQLLEIPGQGFPEQPATEATRPTPATAPTAPTAAPAGGAERIRSIVDDLTKAGARITSGKRTPEKNAAVGGAPNSRHLTGHAYDIVPPPGMSMGELEQQLRSTGVEFAELINEGDHIHIAWAGGQGGSAPAATPAPLPGGARVIAERPKAPKPTARPATAEEKAAYGIPADVPAQMKPDGSIDVISGTGRAAQKRVPAKIQAGYADNTRSMLQIDNAIAAIEKYPKALGLVRAAGENINQRVDPNGVDARAALANIGSMIIHDRSGAAVTAAEAPRLMPFIPRVTDTPEAAVKKLRGLRRELENANAQIDVQFGEEAGYTPAAAPAAPAGGSDRPAPPQRGQVIKGYRYRGGDPAKQSSWEPAR